MELTRQKCAWLQLMFLFLLIFVISPCFAQLTPRAKKLLHGKTVQIDLGFDIYKDRSARSIAEEIVVNGYEGVYYFVCSDKGVRKDVIEELQKKNIPVAALVVASGAYLPVDERPSGWEKYKMEFTNNTMDEYKFMSFVHKEYLDWMKHRIVKLINTNGFDGFTFAEAMYPVSEGLERQNVLYGDISPAFQAEFKKATGNTIFPEFVDVNKPNYYKKIPKVYNDLIEYRVKTVNDFYSEVVNGKDGVRRKCPGVFVATWTLGISFPNGVEKLRRWEGQDIPSMIKAVKPDMHFIQTQWPDWSNHDLKPDYPLLYKPFFDVVKKTDANLPIGFQTDFVSEPNARRNNEWQNLFYKTCQQMKLDSTTYYVFCLRWNIYEEPPRFCKASLVLKDTIELCFDQRISKDCAGIIASRELIDDSGKGLKIKSAEVDGNLLKIVLEGDLAETKKLKLNIGGVKDDPQYRLEPKGRENVIPPDTHISISI